MTCVSPTGTTGCWCKSGLSSRLPWVAHRQPLHLVPFLEARQLSQRTVPLQQVAHTDHLEVVSTLRVVGLSVGEPQQRRCLLSHLLSASAGPGRTTGEKPVLRQPPSRTRSAATSAARLTTSR